MSKSASPIFLYHGVAECRRDAIRDPLYSLPAASVRAQIAWLRARGCGSVTIGEFLSREGVCGAACVITVDDGLESAATHLFPLLAEGGFPAAVFVVAGMVGRRGWVGWGQLDEMRRAGFEIGSHGLTHANLAEATPHEAREELVASRKMIEDRLGAPVRYLSLPGGYRGRSTRGLAAEAGYEAVLGSRFGYNRTPLDRGDMRRFCLRRADGEETVSRIMRRAFWPLAPRYIAERGKEVGKALLRGRLYAAVRNRLIPPGAHRTLPHFPLDE